MYQTNNAQNKGAINRIEILMFCIINSVIVVAILNGFWRAPSISNRMIISFIVFSLHAIVQFIIISRFANATKAYARTTIAIFIVLLILSISLELVDAIWHPKMVYEDTGTDRSMLFSGHNIMLIVPHEDDEINLLSGIIEQYIQYGSKITVVFTTNGDYGQLVNERLYEAIDVLSDYYIPKSDIVFLGYNSKLGYNGNCWSPYGHLYNFPDNYYVTARTNDISTWALKEHPAFEQGILFSRNNYIRSIKNVILSVKPDVIFCVDYDIHTDHRATSLAFETAMGEILENDRTYKPFVFKGFAYSTAWMANDDYFTENSISTKNPYGSDNLSENSAYLWSNRMRLPVAEKSLSRSIYDTTTFIALSKYVSQKCSWNSLRISNSDKVFWLRRTDSILYSATITATSGNIGFLKDYKLFDSNNITEDEKNDGFWVPDISDSNPKVNFSLFQPQKVSTIVLYDHPSEIENILSVKIELSDGATSFVNKINKKGDATYINIDSPNAISGFSITVLASEGKMAGLSEVEAFTEHENGFPSYIKIQDNHGNFAYDYWTPVSGKQTFNLYKCNIPNTYELNKDANQYNVQIDNKLCSAETEESSININCPLGQSMILTVQAKWNQAIQDKIIIRNPDYMTRFLCRMSQYIESKNNLRITSQISIYNQMFAKIISVIR